MSLNVLSKVGDITSKLKSVGDAALNKVGDTLQDTSKGFASSFEDAFEIRGEKTEAQLEMELWQRQMAEGGMSTSQAAGADPGGSSAATAQAANSALSAAEGSKGDDHVIGSDPESLAAVANVASALKEVRSHTEGLRSDDQASVYDKVIHQQRMQLAKLNKERQALAEERRRMEQEMLSLRQPEGTPLSPVRLTEGISGGKPAEKTLLGRIRNVKGLAGVALLLLAAVLFALRMQSSLSSSVYVDDTWDVQIERAEMEKLVGDLLKDKALLVKDKRGASSASNSTARDTAMDRHLATVQRMLGDMHKKSLGDREDRSNKLYKENLELASELNALREQIAKLRNSTAPV